MAERQRPEEGVAEESVEDMITRLPQELIDKYDLIEIMQTIHGHRAKGEIDDANRKSGELKELIKTGLQPKAKQILDLVKFTELEALLQERREDAERNLILQDLDELLKAKTKEEKALRSKDVNNRRFCLKLFNDEVEKFVKGLGFSKTVADKIRFLVTRTQKAYNTFYSKNDDYDICMILRHLRKQMQQHGR